jgi:cyclophilin family peptidyl-prolyl cis-trans isomerase
MAVIVIGTLGGPYLASAGLANRSTQDTTAHNGDAVDQTQPTPSVTPTPTATAGPNRAYSAPPPMSIDPNQQYTATINTSKGTFTAQLYSKDAPQTVNSFVYLAQNHYFDGLSFDRVVPGFVIQGGDPHGDATGNPGYTLPDEINNHSNQPGTLAMANSGPGTDGSTFYVDLAAQPNLDGRYTVFGQVSSGMDVVNAIGQSARDPKNVTAPAVAINSITISPS